MPSVRTFTHIFRVVLLLVYSSAARAQFYNLPNDYFFARLTEKQLLKNDSAIHPGIQPYVVFFSPAYQHVADSHKVFKYISEDPGLNLVFYDHTIKVEPKNEKLKLRFDPLINFEGGRDLAKSTKQNLYTNTRGILASGSVGDKFYFETMFSENQSVFPQYVSDAAKSSSIVPGQGRWKTFKTTGYDYAFASGFFSVQLHKQVNLQVGHGKQKVGYGYRSLLLSDNSFNYPYARITFQAFKGKLQYSTIYASLMNLTKASVNSNTNVERLFQKKAAAFQYLSLHPNRFLHLGLFQGLVWQAGDYRNKQNITWQYANPLIFANMITYGLSGRNNVLVGAEAQVTLAKGTQAYVQYMLDELGTRGGFSSNGVQLGIKAYDVLGIKNLFLQTEYNYVGGASYQAPGTYSTQTYAHYNQNLAYTPGAGQEFLFLADYRYKRWFVNAKYNYLQNPAETKAKVFTNSVNAKIGYLINSAYNLNVCIGVNYRNQNFYNFKTLNNETGYVYLGLRTSIYNLYYDF